MLKVLFSFYHMIHPAQFEIKRPEGLSNYLFIRFNTPAEVWLNGRWVPVLNHYIVFEPDQPQWYRAVGDKPYCDDFIDFLWDPLADGSAFFNKLSIPMNAPIPCYDEDWVSQTIQRLSQVRLGPKKWRDEIAAHELSAMFYSLCVALNPSGSTTGRYLSAFYKLRSALYLEPPRNVQISQLAASLGLSSSYFQSIYKAYFSISVGADIILGRLDHARHLLSGTADSISSIAQQSGYENTEHFIRQFKKHEGITPGQYRRKTNAAAPEAQQASDAR